MILSRVIKHLKEQHWTAIGIDLLIVILGVFIGAQASNWNEERKVRAGEHEYLVRLHEDMSTELNVLQAKAAYMSSAGQAGRRAEAFIAAGKPCKGNCWRVLLDFFAATQFQDLSSAHAALQTLQDSPYPYDQGLKREIVGFYSVMQQAVPVAGPSEYRRRMRLKAPMNTLLALWKCNITVGETQRFNFACPPGASDAEAGKVVEALRTDPELRAELAVDVGMRATLAQLIADNDARGRVALRKIEAKIGK